MFLNFGIISYVWLYLNICVFSRAVSGFRRKGGKVRGIYKISTQQKECLIYVYILVHSSQRAVPVSVNTKYSHVIVPTCFSSLVIYERQYSVSIQYACACVSLLKQRSRVRSKGPIRVFVTVISI